MFEDLRKASDLYGRHDYAAALESLKALRIDEEYTEAFLEREYLLGLCKSRLELWDQALSHLEQVVTRSEDFARVLQCRMTLAYVYARTGRFKLAEYELGKLVGAGMESAQVFAFMGYAAWAQGRGLEAERFYARALDLDPESPTALNGLGFVLACEGRESARALSCCRKAVGKKPDNPAYLDSLAWVYFRLGFEAEALDFIKQALALAPNEAEIREHARAIAAGR